MRDKKTYLPYMGPCLIIRALSFLFSDTVRGYSRVRFLVSLIVKEGDNQVHKSEVEQVIYFSKYNVVLADVDNEF